MADDPVNQRQFAEDVAAAAAAGDGESFANVGGDMNTNFQMPSVEEVWKLIEQMQGLSDEDRASLKDNLYMPEGGSTEEFLKRYSAQPAMRKAPSDYIIFFVMIAIISLVFALFGYKLYKSLKEKELKKQAKGKNKQSKKSKKAN